MWQAHRGERVGEEAYIVGFHDYDNYYGFRMSLSSRELIGGFKWCSGGLRSSVVGILLAKRDYCIVCFGGFHVCVGRQAGVLNRYSS